MKHYLRLAVGLVALLGSCSYDFRLTFEHEFTWDTTGLRLLEVKTRNGSFSVVGGYVGEVANFDVTKVCYGRDKEDAGGGFRGRYPHFLRCIKAGRREAGH